MKIIEQVNPTRKLVGRVFLWFWLTCLVTAVIAVWSSRFFFEELSVTAVTGEERDRLTKIGAMVDRDRAQRRPMQEVLRRISGPMQGVVVAVDRQSGDVIRGPGPPIRPADMADIRRIAEQETPIALRRGIVRITGPVSVMHDNRPYAVFLLRVGDGPPHRPSLFVLIAIAIVISGVLSYWFARSLVRPLLTIKQAAGELAKGNWTTRVGDATDRKDEVGQLARDFNAMAERLASMWEAQQRLLADISHELRSPLARLQMGLGIAHQKQVDPALLSRIEQEAERMESLIAQLLALSRAESGAFSPQSVSLPELCEELFGNARFEARAHDKEVLTEPLPEMQVEVDRELCLRALENVMRNAIRYCRQRVSVSAATNQNSWSLCVCDDGPGLSQSECEHIFAPFYRTSCARDRETGGIGLGLAIAKAAVQMHHGSIHAEPLSEGGLKVVLTFPLNAKHNELDTDTGN